jgi:hypothetical protein
MALGGGQVHLVGGAADPPERRHNRTPKMSGEIHRLVEAALQMSQRVQRDRNGGVDVRQQLTCPLAHHRSERCGHRPAPVVFQRVHD